LFSNDQVAAFVNLRFEAVWESVRPVPVVRIDFGGGNVLTRTLHGNIVSMVCDADGRVLDALPGLYAPGAYVDRLNQLRLLARYLQTGPEAQRADLLAGYHRRQVEALAKGRRPEQFAEARKVAPITKAIVERPTEVVLQPAGAPAPQTPAALPPQKPSAATDVTAWKSLAEDTELNETTRRRQIHEILASVGPVRPAGVSRRFYKEVLHADLDDPYLGLGPTLFGTYPFSKEDGGG
jgi:hypothetical protein